MTEHDLSVMLREHLRADEPPLTLTADTAILRGRRALRRRRVRRGVLAAAVIGAAAAALPMVLTGGSDKPTSGINPVTVAALADYDASTMPTVLRQAAVPLLQDFSPTQSEADRGTFTASDDQDVRLPEKYWDKASSMKLTFGSRADHQLRIELVHAGSEAEGDARDNCQGDLESGYAFSCDVTTAGGDVVTVRVYAFRALDAPAGGSAGWGVVTREELRTGKPVATDPSQRPIDRDEIFFVRSVQSVHSATFLTVVGETVKAPTFAAATDAFTVPVQAMVDVVSDPSLVIPKPPIGDNGCPWMLHPENSSCDVQKP